jgi:hypothetical protein
MNPNGRTADAELEAARLLLSRLGVTPEQLLADGAASIPIPTFADGASLQHGALDDSTNRQHRKSRNLPRS